MSIDNILTGHTAKVTKGTRHIGEKGIISKNDGTYCVIIFLNGKSLIPIENIEIQM